MDIRRRVPLSNFEDHNLLKWLVLDCQEALHHKCKWIHRQCGIFLQKNFLCVLDWVMPQVMEVSRLILLLQVNGRLIWSQTQVLFNAALLGFEKAKLIWNFQLRLLQHSHVWDYWAEVVSNLFNVHGSLCCYIFLSYFDLELVSVLVEEIVAYLRRRHTQDSIHECKDKLLHFLAYFGCGVVSVLGELLKLFRLVLDPVSDQEDNMLRIVTHLSLKNWFLI